MADLVQAIRKFLAVFARRLFGFGRDREDYAEVEQSAIAIALEIEREKHREIDLSAAEDQSELEKRLKHEWRELRPRQALISVDETKTNSDGDTRPGLIDTLAAPADSDPFLAMLQDDEEPNLNVSVSAVLALREDTYSEFAAYLTFLHQVEMSAMAASAHLAISPRRFWHRVRHAYSKVRAERSPFDRIVVIEQDFYPRAGMILPVKARFSADSRQLPLQFP